MNWAEAARVIADAIAAVDQALAKTDPTLDVPPGALRECREELQRMAREIETDALPAKNMRPRGMGHMVVDSWPLKHRVSEAVVRAQQAYLDL
jgi:hypothetical protein